MTRQVALLRGINVGGNRKVPMAALRAAVQGLGYDEVATHLQSGNVVLTSDAPEEEVALGIERVVAEEIGVAGVTVMVRTAQELAAVVALDPFPDADDPSKYFVSFLSSAPDPAALDAVDPAAYAPEAWHLDGRELYLWLPDGAGRTRLTAAFWERRLTVPGTARNWRTVTRLLEMVQG